MSRGSKAVHALVISSLLLLLFVPIWSQQLAEHAADRVIVKLKPGIESNEIDAVRKSLDASVVKRFKLIGAELWKISGVTVEEAIARYAADPRVEYIEPDYVVHALEVIPNDPYFDNLWGLRNTGQTGGTVDADIDASDAWEISTGGNVVLGVIDTGVDWTHEDLSSNIWTNPGEIPDNGIDDDGNGYVDDVRGWDFVNNDNNPMDDHGHGTHVSGTIAAVGNNGIGVVGVCWTAKIMPLKFLDSSGSGYDSDAVLAIEYATMMGARFTSNSWGGGLYSEALRDAIAASGDAGMLFIAAAGNSGDDNDVVPHFPSSYDLDNIISVAATDHNDYLAYFSCYGATSVDLAAPGVNIYSSLPGNQYGVMSGTSMATPHVSGAVSLFWSQYPSTPALSVRDRMFVSVDPVVSLEGKLVTGGRLNVFKMMAEPDIIPPAPITDLAAGDPTSNGIALTWTATGDDGASGTAAGYDIRYSLSPIDEGSFDSASKATGEPHPKPAGSSETFTVHGLAFNTTYYFAIKALDEWGNPSPVSNSPSATTLGVPHIVVSPDALSDDLLTGQTSTKSLTIEDIVEESTLDFCISIGPAEGRAATVMPALRRTRPGGRDIPEGSRDITPMASSRATAARGHSYSAGRAGSGVRPATVSAPAKRSVFDLKILLLHSADVSEIRDLLLDFPDISVVDVFDGGSATPTLETLIGYDAVILINGTPFLDPFTIGNILADYVDSGGGVVMTLASFISSWDVGGRFASGGYYPFTLGSGPVGAATLADFDAGHPIMLGVSTAWGDVLGATTLAPGAEWVADWNNGQPFIATQGDHVVGANVFVSGGGYWTGDIPLILHNAVVWSVGASWLGFAPECGTVVGGASADVQVTFDATGLDGGDYFANLVVASNDSNNPEVAVPVALHVTGAPDIAVSPAAIGYGPLFLGATKLDTLVISNAGTDLLSITNLALDNGDFSADLTPFDLEPHARHNVAVAFAPTVVGPIEGTLTLTTNDPDEGTVVVELSGEGVMPPVMVCPPSDTLRTYLFTNGTRDTVLSLCNDGESPLGYCIEVAMGDETAFGSSAARIARAAEASAGGLHGTRASASSAVPAVREPHAMRDCETAGKAPRATFGVLKKAEAATASVFFSDGFEDGTYDKWIDSGMGGMKEITNATAAKGVYSLREYQSPGDHFSGIYHDLGAIQPGYVGFYIRSGSTSTNDAYVVIRDSQGFDAIFFFAEDDGFLYVNDDVTGDHSIAYEADRWYHVEFKNIDFQSETFDYYVDGDLVKSGIQFRYAGSISDLYRVDLYNYDFGSQAWWDEIVFADEEPPLWLRTSPVCGSVPPHSCTDVTVTFDASGMLGGDYFAELVIAGDDPITPECRIPARLHVTGAPDIAATPMELDYGTRFIGTTKPDSISISNEGTDVLNVSEMTVDNADFEADLAPFSLVPGQRRNLVVTFSPSEVGQREATLSITSDDPDEGVLEIALRGEGLEPPVISVTPDSLSDSLFTGQTSIQQLTIDNSAGLSDLTWTVAAQYRGDMRSVLASSPPFASHGAVDPRKSSPSFQAGRPDPKELFTFASRGGAEPASGAPTNLETILSHLDANYADVTATIPNRFDFSEGETGSGIIDGGLDMYDGGNYLSTDLGGPIDYSNDVIVASPSFGINGRYFTRKYTGLFVMAADLDGVSDFIISGNLGADGWGSVDGAVLEARVSGLDFYGFVKRVYDAGDPSVNHLVIVAKNPAVGHEFSTDTNDDYHRVVNLSGSNRVYYLLYAGAGGSYIDNAAALNIMSTFLGAIGLAPEWVRIVPSSGTIPAGASAVADVTFDATGLYGGEYDAALVFASNDPVNPEVGVAAHLHVTGMPDIAAPAFVDYGPLFVGATKSDTLVVANAGTDVLSVSEMTIDNAEFSADLAPFDLAPEESRPVVITFAPSGLGAREGTLTITSNDPDEGVFEVALVGEGMAPPVISVSPDSLGDSLLTGETAVHHLTLSNTGQAELTFVIRAGELVGAPMAAANTWERASRRGDEHGRASESGRLASSKAAQLVNSRSDHERVAVQPVNAIEAVGDSAILVIQDWDAWGVVMSAFIQDEFGISSTVINSSQIASTDFTPFNVIITTGDQGSEYYDAVSSNVAKFEDFVNDGGVVQYQLATQGSNVAIAGGVNVVSGHYEDYNTVVSPDHPIVAGLPTVLQGSFANHTYLTNLPAGTVVITETTDSSLPTTAEYRLGGGTVVATGMTWEFLYIEGFPAGAMLRNAVAYSLSRAGIRWLSFDPREGTVPPMSSIDVAVLFDATGMNDGDYDARIFVASNDPINPEISVPAHLHVTGAPDIAVSPLAIDYGTVFVGFPKADTLSISNAGTDTLHVSGLSVDDDDFSADLSPFNLAPGGWRELVVSFTPSESGAKDGILSISSDDADEGVVAVALHGEGVEPPVISVSPSSVIDTLAAGGTSVHVLTVANTGGSDLNFIAKISAVSSERSAAAPGTAGAASDARAVGVRGGGPPSALKASALVPPFEIKKGQKDTRTYPPMDRASGGPDQFGYRWRDSNEPGGPVFDWIDASSGSSIALGDDDFAVGIPLGFTFSYYGEEFTTIGVGSNGWLSFNGYATWFPGSVPSVDGCAGAIAPYARDLYPYGANYIRYATVGVAPSRRFVVEYNGIRDCCPSGSPKTFEVIFYESTDVIRFQYLIAPDDPYGFGIESPDQTMGMGNGGEGDLFISPEVVEDNYAIEFSVGAPWLSVAPTSGSVHPGGSTDLTVTMDATWLPAGDYEAAIVITSNDPETPEWQIPARLTVLGGGGGTVRLAGCPDGWYLRCWNVDTPTDSTHVILEDIMDHLIVALGYDGGGLSFYPSIPSRFNTLKTMDHLHGYWFRMSGDDTLRLEGDPVPPETPIPLSAGWNVASCLLSAPDSTAHAVQSILPNVSVVLGFECGGLSYYPTIPPEFNTLQVMEPGRGYWIKMLAADTLIYPETAVYKAPSAAAVSAPARVAGRSGSKVLPTREWINLWGQGVRVDGLVSPVGTVVKAVDEDGVVCGECVMRANGDFGLMPIYRNDPDTDVDEGAEVGEKVTVYVGEVKVPGEIRWTEQGDVVNFKEAFLLGDGNVETPPSSFALLQNYPNPFNPATVIRYELPRDCSVQLVIYNVQGQVVRELVSRWQKADRYVVEWDGKNTQGGSVASGIYFYRIKAGEFSSTKKMVLLR